MEQIIQSSDLFVMQVEMDVYTALKKVTWQRPPPPYPPTYPTPSPTPVEQTDPLQMFLKSSVLSPQWMFLQLNPSWDGPIKQLLADADAWLCKRRTGTTRLQRGAGGESSLRVWTFGKNSLCSADLCEKEPFLNTEEGAPFRSVFKHVRLQYIINDLASARILERDNILPPGKT